MPKRQRAVARIVAQSDGVLSGSTVAAALARSVGLRVDRQARDGRPVRRGVVVQRWQGDVRRILSVERTALNFLMHLSGVATATRAAVRAAGPGGPRVYATRKTLPGLRDLEKSAVVHGGGYAHRRDLSDQVLVKNTHLLLTPAGEAVATLRRRLGSARYLQVEVRSAPEAVRAARAGADSLLLDNRSPMQVRRIVQALRREGLRERLWLEISGGLSDRNLGRYRRTGVDAASLGGLTHSAPAVPFHLVLDRPAGSDVRRHSR